MAAASFSDMAAAIFCCNSFLTADDCEAGGCGVAPGVFPLVEGLESGFSDSETLDVLRSTKSGRISLPVEGSIIAMAAEGFFSVCRYFTTGNG